MKKRMDFKLPKRRVLLELVPDAVAGGSTLYIRSQERKGKFVTTLVPSSVRDKLAYLRWIVNDPSNSRKKGLLSMYKDIINLLEEHHICR